MLLIGFIHAINIILKLNNYYNKLHMFKILYKRWETGMIRVCCWQNMINGQFDFILVILRLSNLVYNPRVRQYSATRGMNCIGRRRRTMLINVETHMSIFWYCTLTVTKDAQNFFFHQIKVSWSSIRNWEKPWQYLPLKKKLHKTIYTLKTK